MAALSLFIVLGGSAYAAVAITGRDVKDGSLTGADVRNSSLTTKDVENRSLLARDFKPGELRAGPRGRRGRRGPAGPANVTVRSVTERVTVPVRDIVARCEQGERATGGAARAAGDPDPTTGAVASFEPQNRPTPDANGATPTGWQAHFEVGAGETWTVTVYAVCAA